MVLLTEGESLKGLNIMECTLSQPLGCSLITQTTDTRHIMNWKHNTFTIMGLTQSRDEIYDVQVHFQWAKYILDNFVSCFLDYRNIVRLVDIY